MPSIATDAPSVPDFHQGRRAGGPSAAVSNLHQLDGRDLDMLATPLPRSAKSRKVRQHHAAHLIPYVGLGSRAEDSAAAGDRSFTPTCGRYALTAARILIHYMINGGFLGATGEADSEKNYILDHVDRLRDIPVHIVHGRYDRVCQYQAEALVRALRGAGNNEVHYFITTAGHSSLEPETDSRLRAIMDDLPPRSPLERAPL